MDRMGGSHGGVLTLKSKLQKKCPEMMIFQEHGDVLIMAGRFQLEFEHCVPARERWENTFGHCQQFRPLSERELQGVQNEIARHGRQDGDGPDKRLNCTLRWNHNHNSHCPCHLGVQHGVQNKGTPSQVHPWPMQNPGPVVPAPPTQQFSGVKRAYESTQDADEVSGAVDWKSFAEELLDNCMLQSS